MKRGGGGSQDVAGRGGSTAPLVEGPTEASNLVSRTAWWLLKTPKICLQELQIAGINFKAFDLGGHEIARRVWKDYYASVSCFFTGQFLILGGSEQGFL